MRDMRKLFSAGLAGCVVLLSACGREADYRVVEGAAWHTTYRIVYQGPERLADSVVAVFGLVEESLSPFSTTSRITAINNNTDSVADALIAAVLTESQRVNSASGGAFDPTVSPLVNLWGFGFEGKDGVAPTQGQIDSVLQFVGIDKVIMTTAGVVRKVSPAMQFNFSAITKGYGCDIVGDVLRRNGVENYMVEIGGEIVASGVNASGVPWRIQIDAPVDDAPAEHHRLRVMSLDNCAVATSGNYRNYRDLDGKGRVGHTISPFTGYPVVGTTLSATVVAPRGLTADAFATAAMAMPVDSAIAMLEREPATEAMLVIADSTAAQGWQLVYTSGFER